MKQSWSLAWVTHHCLSSPSPHNEGGPWNRPRLQVLKKILLVQIFCFFLISFYTILQKTLPKSTCLTGSFICGAMGYVKPCSPHWIHDDVMTWKHFPNHWNFVRGLYLVESPHKYGALVFSLLLVWTSCWTNSQIVGDLRHLDAQETSI